MLSNHQIIVNIINFNSNSSYVDAYSIFSLLVGFFYILYEIYSSMCKNSQYGLLRFLCRLFSFFFYSLHTLASLCTPIVIIIIICTYKLFKNSCISHPTSQLEPQQ